MLQLLYSLLKGRFWTVGSNAGLGDMKEWILFLDVQFCIFSSIIYFFFYGMNILIDPIPVIHAGIFLFLLPSIPRIFLFKST